MFLNYIQNTIVLIPENVPQFKIYVNQGIELKKEGNIALANDLFLKALEIAPDYKPALHHLADIYELRNELDKALACNYKILKLEPDKIYNKIRLQKVLLILQKISSRIYFLSLKENEKFLVDIAEALLFIHRLVSSENSVQKEVTALIEEIILSSTLFTIDVGKQSGFTDQLMQFCIYYKLGKIAGMNYIHTDFYSPRSSENIYNFLGFNSYWETNINSLREQDNIKKVEYTVSQPILEEREIYSLTDLIQDVKKTVISQYEVDRKLILVFPNIRNARRKLSKLVNKQIPYFPDGLNLRNCYFEKRDSNLNNQILVTKNNTIETLIHIRLGDTGIIKSSWDRFISVRNGKIQETMDFPKNRVTVYDFYKVVNLLSQNSEKLNLSFSLFSDGYQLTFESLIKNLKLANETEKVKSLKKLKLSYENEQFKNFDRLNLSQKYIGESDEKLFQLIDRTLNSPIIITSINQRMMPKLMSLFPDELNKQILIVLSTSNHLDFESLVEVGISLEKVHIFNVNITTDLEHQIDSIIDSILDIKINS